MKKLNEPSQTTPKLTNEAAPIANSKNTIQQRSKRNSPQAETAIASAIDAIIEHNNKVELHDLKWAISINAVKELVSDVTKSQRLVDKAIKERFNQIQINHNHRHKRKINDVISVN